MRLRSGFFYAVMFPIATDDHNPIFEVCCVRKISLFTPSFIHLWGSRDPHFVGCCEDVVFGTRRESGLILLWSSQVYW